MAISLPQLLVGCQLGSGGLRASGSAGGIGYFSTTGSAVLQATNKATGVTINALSGQITTSAAALNAGVEVTFTVTNSTVTVRDVPVVALKYGGATASPATYMVGVSLVANGFI